MRTFKIPFDVSGEEKIIKGKFSFRQIGYMFLILLTLAIVFTKILIFLKIILILPLVAFFLACAFLQIEGVYFDKYIIYFLKFSKKKKVYLYKKY